MEVLLPQGYQRKNCKLQTPRKSKTSLALLLSWYVLMIAGWSVLIFQVPVLFQGARPSFQLDRKSGLAVIHHNNASRKASWTQKIYFDTKSGNLSWDMSRDFDDLAMSFGIVGEKKWHRILAVDSQGNDLPIRQYRVIPPADTGIPERLVSFPQQPTQIEDQFIVAADVRHLLVMDYTADTPAIVKTYDGAVFPFGEIQPIDGVRGFLQFERLPIGLGNPPCWQLKLYAIEDDLTLTLKASWPALDLGIGRWRSSSQNADEIASFNPASFELEFRKSATGELIETMPLPDGMDPVALPCYLGSDFFRIDPTTGASRYLDLKRRKWLPEIAGMNFGPHVVLEDKFILFRGRQTLGEGGITSKVFDLKHEKVVSTFDSNVFTEFIDEDSILDVAGNSGMTFKKIDLRTGRVMESWQPFWWVIPFTTILSVSWLIWSWLWLLRSNRTKPDAVWIDIALTVFAPLLLCIIRVNAVGPIGNSQRLPFEIGQGILFSFLAIGVVWAVNAKLRIASRVLPFLLATTIMAASIAITFQGQYASFAPEFIKALVPLAGCFLCFAAYRLAGFQLLPDSIADADTKSSGRSFVTIRDMFILTAVLAMLFASVSPWIASISNPINSMTELANLITESSILMITVVFTWCLAMSPSRFLWLGRAVFFGSFAFLVASAAHRFTGTSSLIDLIFGVYPKVNALPAICFVVMFWTATCFRMRGWRYTQKTLGASAKSAA